MLLQETHFTANDVSRLKTKKNGEEYAMQRVIYKAELPILICDKVDFRAKKITSHKVDITW